MILLLINYNQYTNEFLLDFVNLVILGVFLVFVTIEFHDDEKYDKR